jgi:DNA-binding PadR family transcriptional regulator
MERRAYGYELVQRLNARVGPGWQLNPSAVYNALDDLQHRGCIRPVERHQPTARSAPRVTYEATATGVEAFEEWIEQPAGAMPLRGELLLRMAVARRGDLPRLIEQTLARERECRERIAAHGDPVSAEQLVADGCPWPEVAAQLLRDADLALLGAKVAWLSIARQAMRAVLAREQPAG